MGVAERAAAFLGHIQAQAGPAVQQLNSAVQSAGQSIANLNIFSGGQTKNQAVNSMPLGAGSLQARTQQLLGSLFSAVPTSVQRTASTAGGIIPSAMETLNLPGSNAVRQFQQQKGNIGDINSLTASRALGYGLGAATAAGLLGAGYVAGAVKNKRERRLAGQDLGAQHGVQMPPERA